MTRGLLQRLFAAAVLGALAFPTVAGAASASSASDEASAADNVKFAGLSPEEAVREMTLPPGFRATLFAGEPDVKQPIAFAQDDRGRLWVAEAYTYPRRAPEGEGRDRILVFEDRDGDGRFDRRTVFLEKLNLVSGLEVGFGGVWIGAAPQLLFVPIQDGDQPKPAGEPKVLLDGWDYLRDTHETLNTFTWGPDGWLYGCHGVFCPSFVGKPGTPAAERQRVDAAVWRYHPVRHQFEVFAEGTSNPWGVDFDARGQCFIEACVIPHLWHMIQGGRYERQGGQHYNIDAEETAAHSRVQARSDQRHINPFIYDDIKTIADHFHYTGNRGPHAANGRSDAAGGGHAHAGLMIYQADSWPAQYRGAAFMNNIHGQRINVDLLERSGSGFVGHHAPDFLNFNDRWSQVINLRADQDGSVYLIDWYDKNQCHHNNVDGHDRSNGRIFKVTYGQTRATAVDLAAKSSAELVQLELSPNDWQARHARRILQERGEDGTIVPRLEKIVREDADPVHKLRALWTLHVTAGLSEAFAQSQLQAADEYVRSWTIQLIMENRRPSRTFLAEFRRLAQNDPSPVVRLYLASALQRMAYADRGPILETLLGRSSDTTDHNLPLMYWYALEPLAATHPEAALELLPKIKIPLVRQFLARRLASLDSLSSRN